MGTGEDSIWAIQPDLDTLNAATEGTLMTQLGIEMTEVTENSLAGTMPVDARTHQPLGMLHGGATAALAETLGSFAGSLVVDPQEEFVVGVALNINHLQPISSGQVQATASPLHLGSSIQVWGINVYGPDDRMIAIARLTLAVRQRTPDGPAFHRLLGRASEAAPNDSSAHEAEN